MDVNKPLEEIIKETKITKRGGPGGPAGNRRGGPRRGGRGGAVAQGQRFGNRSAAGGNAVPRRQSGGGVQKRRSGGGNASLSPSKAASAINGKWTHDLYQNGQASNGGGPSKLVISNLDFGVSDQDIQNLFQEFGRLKRANVHYDKSGRSLGTAEVLFDKRSDAIRAMNHYNGVSLDGRPMSIEVIGGSPRKAPVNVARRSGGGIGPNRRRGGGGGGGPANRGGNRPRGNRPQGKKQPKTAAELDAELDAHNAQMQTD